MEYQHNEHHHRFDVNPILVGLLGVLAGAIVVAICHCIIVFCNDTQGRMVNNIATINNDNAAEHPTVQVIVQSKEYKEDVCCICLGEFKQHERVRVLPECAHIFHVTCIDKWLQHHSNCPLCRASAIHPPLVDANSSPEIDDRISGLGGGGGGGVD